MTPLNKIKFKILKDYLESQNVFGLTVQRRKHTLIYSFSRYFIKLELNIRVKVMKLTKYVSSVEHEGTIYTDFDKLKELVEKRSTQKMHVKKC